MGYSFEKYSVGGGASGSDNGFIVINFDGEESGTITLPEGITYADMKSNPSRFVFTMPNYSGIFGYEKSVFQVMSNNNASWLEYVSLSSLVAESRSIVQKIVLAIQYDLTYTLTYEEVKDNGFIVIPIEGEEGTITLPEGVTQADIVSNLARFVFIYSPMEGFPLPCTYDRVETSSEGLYVIFKSEMKYDGVTLIVEIKVDLSLNYTVSVMQGGSSGGGMSINSITFTDRPSAFEWLTNNGTKFLKAVITTNLAPDPLLFNTLNLLHRANDTSDKIYKFDNIFAFVTDSQLQINNVGFQIDGNRTAVTMSPAYARLANEQVEVSATAPTDFTDDYWSAMAVSLTIYYIE